MRILVYPYKLGSKSSKALAQALNSIRIRPYGRYRARYYDTVINWGNTTIPYWGGNILNKPENVALATSKLTTFQKFQEHNVPCPDWTTDKQTAKQWITEGHEVYARTQLSGHSGSGIVVCSDPNNLTHAKLYTKRVKAKYEFRVHVFKGKVIDFQQKKRRNGAEANPYIRNHSNGYVYARSDVALPEVVAQAATKAVSALSLDFGAVDIGYVSLHNTAYCYEVNTAPGLENTTISKYKAAILQEI